MFYRLLLEKNNNKKSHIDKIFKKAKKFNSSYNGDGKYKVSKIQNNVFYAKEYNSHLLKLYYWII